ncbi:hypothetical protein [Paucibacter soli]|uniref:hypothetical protein n=1 Tax=Paucibacter soli TaxID=3133433 RepID=UPI0030A8F58F
MNAFILHFELTRPRPWGQLWSLLLPWRKPWAPAAPPGAVSLAGTDAGKRAVPTPAHALQALLDRLGPSSQGLSELGRVACTLRLAAAHNPLAHLGADTLTQAMRQLEGVADLCHDAELALLHLQMHRRVEELRTRAQAARHGQQALPASQGGCTGAA